MSTIQSGGPSVDNTQGLLSKTPVKGTSDLHGEGVAQGDATMKATPHDGFATPVTSLQGHGEVVPVAKAFPDRLGKGNTSGNYQATVQRDAQGQLRSLELVNLRNMAPDDHKPQPDYKLAVGQDGVPHVTVTDYRFDPSTHSSEPFERPTRIEDMPAIKQAISNANGLSAAEKQQLQPYFTPIAAPPLHCEPIAVNLKADSNGNVHEEVLHGNGVQPLRGEAVAVNLKADADGRIHEEVLHGNGIETPASQAPAPTSRINGNHQITDDAQGNRIVRNEQGRLVGLGMKLPGGQFGIDLHDHIAEPQFKKGTFAPDRPNGVMLWTPTIGGATDEQLTLVKQRLDGLMKKGDISEAEYRAIRGRLGDNVAINPDDYFPPTHSKDPHWVMPPSPYVQ